MNERIHHPPHQRLFLFIRLCACVVFSVGVSACGSTGSRQQPGVGTGGHPGGASGQGGGGASGQGSGGATGSGGAGGKGGGGGAGGSAGTGGAAPMPGTPCSKNQDCGTGFALMCRAPGEFLGCGACQQGRGNCASDTDCAGDAGTGGKLICDPAPSTNCFCSGTRICLTGCRDKGDCPSGQNCNNNHQCQNTCVPGDGTCPVDFSCGSDGFFGRTLCTGDAECSGACVKGFCYSTRGSCEYTPI